MAAVPSLSFLQANLDHTRAASSHLIDYIEAQAINVVIVGDPYARSGKLPGLPNSITQLSQATDPKVMVLLQHVQMDIFSSFHCPICGGIKIYLTRFLIFIDSNLCCSINTD